MLEVRGLGVAARGGRTLLNDVDLAVPRGTVVGLTGRSGSGKTTLVRSVMGTLEAGCRVVSGTVALDGEDLGSLSPRRRRALCGLSLGLVPQNPMTAFDAERTLGAQMGETLRVRLGLARAEVRACVRAALGAASLDDGERVLRSYPDQLSGGMLQRCAIALTLALKPAYVLADEPTSALDADNRAAIMGLLARAAADAGVLLVSHDAQALRAWCSEVYVMEGGCVTEHAPTPDLFERPRRPWTQLFVQAAGCADQTAWAWEGTL